MLASGVILTFLCFFLNQFEIKDNVLWYVAQTLVYSGSIFGVTVYVNSKFGDFKQKLFRSEERRVKNEESKSEDEA